MLEVAGVEKSYGKIQALNGVDLVIRKGEILALLGANGAGKTTLVSIVAGLLRPDAGSVHVAGKDVARDPLGAKALLGIAPQELGVYLQVSVRNNLRFFGRMAGLGDGEIKERIANVSDALGLTELLDRQAHALSGGEKRRLHTAIALLHRPPLLLLDEPTAGVDVQTRHKILDAVRRLAEEGTAVCYTTHYMQEVEALAPSVAILERGSIVAAGSLRQLIASHGTSVVTIAFEGRPPRLRLDEPVQYEGSTVRITTASPGGSLARAIVAAGRHADRVRSLEVIEPSLEAVYLSLTGRRYDEQADSNGGPVK